MTSDPDPLHRLLTTGRACPEDPPQEPQETASPARDFYPSGMPSNADLGPKREVRPMFGYPQNSD